MKPRQVLQALADAMPENAVVSTDIGNICSVANGYIMTDHPRHFLGPMSSYDRIHISYVIAATLIVEPGLKCIRADSRLTCPFSWQATLITQKKQMAYCTLNP